MYSILSKNSVVYRCVIAFRCLPVQSVQLKSRPLAHINDIFGNGVKCNQSETQFVYIMFSSSYGNCQIK